MQRGIALILLVVLPLSLLPRQLGWCGGCDDCDAIVSTDAAAPAASCCTPKAETAHHDCCELSYTPTTIDDRLAERSLPACPGFVVIERETFDMTAADGEAPRVPDLAPVALVSPETPAPQLRAPSPSPARAPHHFTRPPGAPLPLRI